VRKTKENRNRRNVKFESDFGKCYKTDFKNKNIELKGVGLYNGQDRTPSNESQRETQILSSEFLTAVLIEMTASMHCDTTSRAKVQ
jgi:hypothetical protein